MANTTMMRVNDVIIMSIAGRKVSAVISARICRVTEYSCAPSPSPGVTVKAGIPGMPDGSCARARGAQAMPAKTIRDGSSRLMVTASMSLIVPCRRGPGFADHALLATGKIAGTGAAGLDNRLVKHMQGPDRRRGNAQEDLLAAHLNQSDTFAGTDGHHRYHLDGVVVHTGHAVHPADDPGAAID